MGKLRRLGPLGMHHTYILHTVRIGCIGVKGEVDFDRRRWAQPGKWKPAALRVLCTHLSTPTRPRQQLSQLLERATLGNELKTSHRD